MKLGPKGELLEDLVLDFVGIEARYVVEKSTTVHVRRETTSSRRPGKTIEGRHMRRVGLCELILCECGCYRWSDDVPHAVHWHGTKKHKVDCVGRRVPEETP